MKLCSSGFPKGTVIGSSQRVMNLISFIGACFWQNSFLIVVPDILREGLCWPLSPFRVLMSSIDVLLLLCRL